MATSAKARGASQTINIHQPGDYPIILGESLKEKKSEVSNYSRIRYNWQPENGFTGARGTLKRNGDTLSLAYNQSDARYDYTGKEQDQGTPNSRLFLIYNDAKEAFVLERITGSVDLNLVSGFGKTAKDVKNLASIPLKGGVIDAQDVSDATKIVSQGEEEADVSNPYDFRHFLGEARENAEKSSAMTGGRTPLPGGLTPMSAIASPAPGASRFLSSTPHSLPSKPIQKKKKVDEHSFMRKNTTGPKKSTQASKEPVKPSQILSKERISESDDENIPDIPQKEKASTKGHTRNTSSGDFGRSPHIVVNDGDLEIDMGSPQPEAKRFGRIDPEKFRSRTGTPTFGYSSNAPERPTSAPSRDVEMRDRSDDEDEDDDQDRHRQDNDEMEDEDVDVLDLGSPHDDTAPLPKPSSSSSHYSNRRKSSVSRHANKFPSPSPVEDEDDVPEEDDDVFAAVLAAALDNEDDHNNSVGSRLGLGITTLADDEESEVSEEE